MKHRPFLTLLLCFTISLTSLKPKSFEEVKGTVVWEGKSCDFIIIETNNFYVLAELNSGIVYDGDILAGNLHSYGFQKTKNISRRGSIEIYIENYWGSIDKCWEWLRNKNKCSNVR